MEPDKTDAAWIDVTVPLRDGLTVYPDNPQLRVRRITDVERGDPATVSEISLGSHSGTHVDAPVHFRAGAAGVDELDLDALNGPARVLDVAAVRRIGAGQLAGHGVGPGERILLRTLNSRQPWHTRPFDPGYAHLTAAGARHLVDRGVRTVGVDHLSVGGGDDNPQTHRVLLDAGVTVVEGLDLSAVEPGDHDLRCLPLRIAGGDGAPVRALLRRTGP
ncbi:MAG TPA: cyclase family protein [Pseudonocardia sp.]|nr:cyclase family protein [Pseudonocardia sp.]